MLRALSFVAGGFAGLLLLLVPRACTASSADDSTAGSEKTGAAAPTPVLVELFTSQGCSSCPSADRLLGQLDELAGPRVEVIPLAFHVDYWDRLGWRDPFSSPRWSARQGEYARAFGSERVYTPQLVVGGRADAVGSDRRRVGELVEAAVAAPPAGTVALAAERRAETLHVAARASAPADLGPLELHLAVVESGLVTAVERGENARRTLHNDFVVRHLELVGVLRGGGLEVAVDLPLVAGWRAGELRVVGFLQDPETREVHGAARVRPAPGP